MIMKLLLLGVVGYVIYILFFKKGGITNRIDQEESETMVECAECSVYISTKDAIIKDGKYYCSKECAALS